MLSNMPESDVFNIRNPKSLSNALTQILFIVEYFNHIVFNSCYSNSMKDDPLPVNMNSISVELSAFRRQYCQGSIEWNSNKSLPYLINECQSLGIKPSSSDALIFDLVVSHIFPFRDMASSENKDYFSVGQLSKISDILDYYYLRSKYFILHNNDMASISTTALKLFMRNSITHTAPERLFVYLDTPFNFIHVMQDIIMNYCNLQEAPASHYIQRWIRKTFDLHYNMEMKTALAAVVNTVNQIFFLGSQEPSVETKRRRSETVGLDILLSAISTALKNPNFKLAKQQSIGVYLLMRLCNMYRVRYVWYGDKRTRIGSINSEVDSLYSDSKSFTSIRQGIQCVTALRPVEYNYFQARSFGSFSCMKGLNFIFRGGMLPYHKEGKINLVTGPAGSGKTTYAIQRMVEIAFYGGVTIYCSVEEDYDIMFDRLTSFRLTNFKHFKIAMIDKETYATKIRTLLNENTECGLLLFFDLRKISSAQDLSETIDGVSLLLDKFNKKWRAVTIDSVNALNFDTNVERGESESGLSFRHSINNVIDNLRQGRFFSILLAEKDDLRYKMLPYLSDSVIEIGYDSSKGRWIQIIKARNQNFQIGKHPFRISDGRGIHIYPNLGSVLSSLRKRPKSTLSEEKIIPFPARIAQAFDIPGIADKSLSLIWGPRRNANRYFLMQMLCASRELQWEKILNRMANSDRPKTVEPRSIFVITFRSSENRYLQSIRGFKTLLPGWDKIPNKIIRWFSTGPELTPEQIVDNISTTLVNAKRSGYPIERVVFDEIESAEGTIPLLSQEKLFWPTIIEMLGNESVSAFFLIESENQNIKTINELRRHMDYIFHIDQASPESTSRRRIIRLERWIDPRNMAIHGEGPHAEIEIN